jgi:membrane-bound serine protease (ClpP class)
MWNRLILMRNLDEKSGYTTSDPDFSHLVGTSGVAMTDLRPSGTIVIDDKRYDVVTGGEFLDNGTEVRVVEVEGSKVVVREM